MYSGIPLYRRSSNIRGGGQGKILRKFCLKRLLVAFCLKNEMLCEIIAKRGRGQIVMLTEKPIACSEKRNRPPFF